jgi:hypothetical protein
LIGRQQKAFDACNDRPIVPTMDEKAKTKEATLTQPDAAEQWEVMRSWQRVESGMDGPRGLLPDKPDDLVAYKLGCE